VTVVPWEQQPAAAKPAGRDRILIGGRDLTYFREVETLWNDIEYTEPFGYGPASLTFPKVHGTYERLGVGDLDWYRPYAEVRIERRDVDTDALISTDYVGFLISRRPTGAELTVEVWGQWSGKAALMDKHPRAFRHVADVGHLAWLASGDLSLPLKPFNGPVTGVKMVDAGGGEKLDAWASRLCAMSLTTDGVQRTIMPAEWGSSTYRFDVKDTTTPHCTIFTDDTRMVVDLVDDAATRTNRWFGTGITPEGVRIRNIRYPGLVQGTPAPYPMTGGASFTLGTTDADTINGDGITVMQIKLQQMSYFGWDNPITGTFDEVTAEAVMRLKADVRLTVNGTMTQTAWDRLWDVGKTGFSLNGAKVFPLVADTRTEKFLYSATGAVIGRNPDYDPTVFPNERVIDFGTGMTKQQMVDWCRGEQARANVEKNWTGTITLYDLGCWSGQWNGSDAATLRPDPSTGYAGRPDLIMSLRDVRAGMNAWLPLFDGGTLVHIASVKLTRNGPSTTAVLTVDTQARDAREIAMILERDAEASRDVRHEWYAANRSSKPTGGMVPRDEFFGRLQAAQKLKGGQWNAFPVPAGQAGTINRIHVQLTNSKAAFGMVILAEGHGAGQVERELARRIGDPLAAVPDGTDAWWEKDSNANWFRNRDRGLLYAAGTHDQPCGYWPKKHTDAQGNTTGAPITGEWIYDPQVSYLTGVYQPGVVWVAIWPDRDCTVKAGQLLWAQENDVA
jgi:hypothetical protein